MAKHDYKVERRDDDKTRMNCSCGRKSRWANPATTTDNVMIHQAYWNIIRARNQQVPNA